MKRVALYAVALLALHGCATPPPPRAPSAAELDGLAEPIPRIEPLSRTGNHSPYRVHGKTYRVLPTSRGYIEHGRASWYGKKFHGRPTSSMEPYDMFQLTAAHKTLPLPTYARVTNLDNGRAVIVRINDRGPFKDDRIIDLSYAAARRLGFTKQGIANVEVRALNPGEIERAKVVSARGLYVQAGAYSELPNAFATVDRLRGAGIPDVFLFTDRSGTRPVHRVRVGPLVDESAAEYLKRRINGLGYDSPRLLFE